MKPLLQLKIRTPAGLICDQAVQAITAEDEAGWFGILPGRADMIACLPPGFLTFRDESAEIFVVLSSGLLELRSGVCRVLAQDAYLGKDLSELPEELATGYRRRRARGERRKDAFSDLEREALRRLVLEGRS